MLLNLKKASLGHPVPLVSRPPLERMSKLHALLQAGEYPNCASIAREFEISKKTAQRDLDFMRDRLSLPIAYDARKFGFYYTRPVDSLPSLDVSEGELVALFIAQKALHQHLGTVYEAPLRSACTKIAEAMKDRVSVDIHDLANRVFFKGESVSDVPADIFEAVGLAVRECRELRFVYRKLEASKDEVRRVRPYHLGCVNNQWYLFGWDLQRAEMRTFVLSRLQKPKVLEEVFERPRDFSIESFLLHSLGVFSSQSEPQTVRIRFTGWAAQIVRERAWHASQRLTELEDGGVALELRLSSLVEVERWVLSFGVNALVLEPEVLVKAMRSRVAAMKKMYAS
jgi:proteasome accessory factor B